MWWNNFHCSFTWIGSIYVIALRSAHPRNFKNFLWYWITFDTWNLVIFWAVLSEIIECNIIFSCLKSILVEILSTQEPPKSIDQVSFSTVWNMLKEFVIEQKSAFTLSFAISIKMDIRITYNDNITLFNNYLRAKVLQNKSKFPLDGW